VAKKPLDVSGGFFPCLRKNTIPLNAFGAIHPISISAI